MRVDRATGLVYRPSDKVIVDEVKGVYGPMPVRPDDVMLDLGAHIGATGRMVLAKGAARVVAVEADPSNIPLLRRNLDRKRSLILWAAVGAEPGRVAFYVRSDRSFLGSLLEDRGRARVIVPRLPLTALLDEYRPTIVKCDIEFGEYDLPDLRFLPDRVRTLAVEVHIRYAGIFANRPQSEEDHRQRRQDAASLIAAFEAQGFREVRRKDKQAKDTEPAIEDDTGLPPRTKAVDAVWTR